MTVGGLKTNEVPGRLCRAESLTVGKSDRCTMKIKSVSSGF